MSGLLENKTILVTGIITDASIAFHVARVAQQQGARVLITGYGRVGLVNLIARRLPEPVPPAIELDVRDPGQLATLAERVRELAPQGLDGVVHSIAFAPPSCLGNPFLAAPWSDVAVALEVSAYSYAALVQALLPVLNPNGSVVGMDFDPRTAVSFYNWMGVAKNALESVNRYVAREVGGKGIRSNLVAAGPIKTLAAKAIAGTAMGAGAQLDELNEAWNRRAPLGWDVEDPTAVAKSVCAVLSDWLPATTASVLYVDGGAGHISA
ncbi:enoyl-ACP reductase FabI [Nocardia terpenica]|uniref:NADH-dependent enoyl-ACP reductase InhA n=1 Tax=Nocardia terpenica TaxID=455432 RepID=UPI0018962940|nr:NADH-dependent enoyl-ACP reductase InhA [Nocardia terpenica]MBF6064817.1 enoyl-ACP reductase FabI [Nocardia terpenica]MBF6107332.1 enoyl-ACP reductase FabI [Nocardia terpenica]MBF6115089.1 enoyl-ACP reductase FabI [Nocardia terpenica]MBF6122195.1 enoyl-ACP reductase FabI [Nocardia terpenica]MBF6154578.1 enoyl-ACP reductase FabI [Nocardia terpenica]